MIEEQVVKLVIELPAHGQVRISNELKKLGHSVSPGGVCSIWLRHDLKTFNKRLKAQEAQVAQGGGVLTDEQLVELDKANQEKEVHGDIETEHSGYLEFQDTFDVGTIKGVGRIYQQTCVDTYSRVALTKLYHRNNAPTAADLLTDGVVAFFEEQGIPLLRVLTDRGTESRGNREHHEYQLYLVVENIDHSTTKSNGPQTNGICKRFHNTILQKFGQIGFRTRLYEPIEKLQDDLDQWINKHNDERPHSGRYGYEKHQRKHSTTQSNLWSNKCSTNSYNPLRGVLVRLSSGYYN